MKHPPTSTATHPELLQMIRNLNDAPFDPVTKPAHYTEGRTIETIAVIEDWQLGFHLAQVVKYVSRAGRKGEALEDLKKAQWYLARYIEQLK